MTLRDLAVDGLLDPSNLLYERVAVRVKHVESETVFGIDDPDEEEALLLQQIEAQILHDLLVSEITVGDGDASGWVRSRQLPWWVASDDVEEATTAVSSLRRRQLHEEIVRLETNLVTQRHAPELLQVGAVSDLSQSLVVSFSW